MFSRTLRRNLSEVKKQAAEHFRANKTVYLAAGAGIVAGAVGALLTRRSPVQVSQTVNVYVHKIAGEETS